MSVCLTQTDAAEMYMCRYTVFHMYNTSVQIIKINKNLNYWNFIIRIKRAFNDYVIIRVIRSRIKLLCTINYLRQMIFILFIIL